MRWTILPFASEPIYRAILLESWNELYRGMRTTRGGGTLGLLFFLS